MVIEDAETLLHQDVVVGFISGGPAKFIDAGALSNRNPYLRN